MLNSILLWSVGFPEILVLALIVLLLFGGKKIPELMKGLGKGVKSFKDGIKEAEEEIKNTKDELDKPSEEKK
jgi:sec-independent protein translocase protein TatA